MQAYEMEGIIDGYMMVSDELTLHYKKTGDGPRPIIFNPGWTMTTRVFERQMPHFTGSDAYTAYNYDPRGQGFSTKTTEGHFYEQHDRDLAAFIDNMGLDNVVLIGWSNGGYDVLAYINQFGADKLSRLFSARCGTENAGT